MKMKNKFYRQDNHKKMIITSIPQAVWKAFKTCLIKGIRQNDSVMNSHFKRRKQ